jgi:hypothetical protein
LGTPCSQKKYSNPKSIGVSSLPRANPGAGALHLDNSSVLPSP